MCIRDSSKGWQRYRVPLYQAICEETVSWLKLEMLSEKGGFYSSLDADSEGTEGKCYVWSPEQVNDVLGPQDGARFCDAYDISQAGNFENGLSNPVLLLKDFDARQDLVPLREKLLAVRQQRIQPGKDTKQLTAWNALCIRGLAEAGFTFGKREWSVSYTHLRAHATLR